MENKNISQGNYNSFHDSEEFDADWYCNFYADVIRSNIDPLLHYKQIGKSLGRAARATNKVEILDNKTNSSGTPVPFESFGIIRHNPLISVVIVSFNSGKDLNELFPSLIAQSYHPLEIVLIENGNEDTEPLCRNHFPNIHYRRTDNIGFAEANNLACEIAQGEFIALVNPDTRLEPNALQHLLDAMRMDASAAVAVPKINFFTKFVRLTIIGNAPFSFVSEDLLAGLPYRKLFVRGGGQRKGDRLISDSQGTLEVDLPYTQKRDVMLAISSDENLEQVRVNLGYSSPTYHHAVGNRQISVQICFDHTTCSSARYLINNAGSGIHNDGTPYDRGFAEYEDGSFLSKTYLSAICGCACLIRRAAILDRMVFTAAFFAYYEDSELSYWLIRNGYRILYQPESVIYHRHSETTEEGSALWNTLVSRSHLLYRMLTDQESTPLCEFRMNYNSELQGQIRERLENYDKSIRGAKTSNALQRPSRPLACVYNSYFSSMGGGEKHALDIATLLAKNYDVYLASEVDFDISNLASYFNVDLTGIRKIISTAIDKHFSAKFAVFVNSTFHSNLVSAAEKNYYIVSFPHREVNNEIFKCYTFLHNSAFTARWAIKYWHKHRHETILPIIGYRNFDKKSGLSELKRKSILSVGRFDYDGHCKNHHKILQAFRDILDANPDLCDWEIYLIGSYEQSKPAAIRYLADLHTLAEGFPVQLLPNAPRADLEAAYARSAIYVHAAGLGVNYDAPEKHEHFGITCYEAMLYGCAPVVYAVGGPAEQVKGLDGASSFGSEAELRSTLAIAMRSYVNSELDPSSVALFASDMQSHNFENAIRTFGSYKTN